MTDLPNIFDEFKKAKEVEPERTEITRLDRTTLEQAYKGSYYFLAGCGGDLQEWVDGVENYLKMFEIGKPKQWFVTTGRDINDFASAPFWTIEGDANFQPHLICLLFSLEGLDIPKLALFKVQMQDRWFDDVIDNMRKGEF